MPLLAPIVELIWQDETGSTAALQTNLFPGSTYAEADAAALALASVAVSLTGCTLVRQRIVYKFVPDDPDVVAIGSSVLHAGVFILTDESEENVNIVTIPGISDDVLVVTGPCANLCIDQANSDIIALVNTLIDAGFVNPLAVSCTILDAAYVQSRV